jgi:hypothetical protein
MLALIKSERRYMTDLERAGVDSALQTDGKLSLFEYHPYIYKDPIYYNAFLGDVPIIRVGNSLLSGDVNGSTGLEFHLFMILRLKCFLMNRDKCPKLCQSCCVRVRVRVVILCVTLTN